MSRKSLLGISPNLRLWCSWGRRWTDPISRSKGKGHGHRETTCSSKVSTLRGIFLPFLTMHGRILSKYHNYFFVTSNCNVSQWAVSSERIRCVIDDWDWSYGGRSDAYAVLPAGDRSALETHLLDWQPDDVQSPVSLHQSRGQSKLSVWV